MTKPDLIIFVMDGSIGQAAEDQAKAFKDTVEVCIKLSSLAHPYHAPFAYAPIAACSCGSQARMIQRAPLQQNRHEDSSLPKRIVFGC
jgi:hypothetical protein